MLYVHSDCDLRVVHGSESDESGMVFARILGCPGLSAYGVGSPVEFGGGPFGHSQPHSCNYRGIGFGGRLGLVRGEKACRQGRMVCIFMDVRREEEAPVGYRGCQVAELERCCGNVSLSHTGP